MLLDTYQSVPNTKINNYYPATSAFSTTWDTDANVIERGKVWVISFADTGATTQDSTGNQAYLLDSPSGKVPLGVQMHNFVKLHSRQLLDDSNNDQCVWDANGLRYPGTFLTKGWVQTDEITGSPGCGDVAYIGASGTITNFAGASGLIGVTSEYLATQYKIGRFLSDVDSTTGFARVQIEL